MEVEDDDDPITEINMVPLIDVMLVLLIIFMITAPLLTHAVKVDLPRVASAPTKAPDEPLRVDIDASGQMYWNGEAIEEAALTTRLVTSAQATPQAELLIRADRKTAYEVLARVMSTAARSGLARIGFLTDPREAAN